MRNLRFSLRGAVLAGMVLAFVVPAFAQQEGPMQPVERQTPLPPVSAPAPPVTAPPSPAAAGTASNSSAPTSGAPAPNPPSSTTPSAPKPGAAVEVPSGTSIPLVLHNGISTHSAKVGDPVYFETLFPIMIAGRVAIPAGSYVSGEVTETKRAGRVKGRAELMIKLNTLILTNGYMVNLNAVPRSAGTGGGEKVDNEGKVIGDSDKASDVGTVAKTTAAGAGIGGLATQGAKGVGIGAGVGAAAGLMAVLLTRGPDAELPRGTTVDVTLNRPILLDAEKDQFTGPGQASTLAGPQNRESQHGKIF
ncbi:MAG: hypothetical protein WB723_12775 [Candidatus Acidiferrales bacterium]